MKKLRYKEVCCIFKLPLFFFCKLFSVRIFQPSVISNNINFQKKKSILVYTFCNKRIGKSYIRKYIKRLIKFYLFSILNKEYNFSNNIYNCGVFISLNKIKIYDTNELKYYLFKCRNKLEVFLCNKFIRYN